MDNLASRLELNTNILLRGNHTFRLLLKPVKTDFIFEQLRQR